MLNALPFLRCFMANFVKIYFSGGCCTFCKSNDLSAVQVLQSKTGFSIQALTRPKDQFNFQIFHVGSSTRTAST